MNHATNGFKQGRCPKDAEGGRDYPIRASEVYQRGPCAAFHTKTFDAYFYHVRTHGLPAGRFL